MTNLVRSYDPVWFFVDLNGKPLDDTYYLFTLQNELPYLPLPIFHDADGNVVWNDPIEFLANGTLPVDMYWDPDLVYRLEVRAGPTQNDALIYLVENYIPNGGGSNPETNALVTDNQITNPQFSDVNFVPNSAVPLITTANSVDIGPGWTVVTTGSGSLTIRQLTFAGTDGVPTNASYGISIANNGFDSVVLRQRFNGNGALWSGQTVNIEFTAKTSIASEIMANITYSDATSTEVVDAFTQTGFISFSDKALLPISNNPDLPSVAWTDLDLTWSGNITVSITSVQLIGEAPALVEGLPYEQITLERQVDHEFHYWQPKLNFKPVPSYTIGWDFAFNPCQELGTTVGVSGAGANTSRYIADQTIAFESVGNVMTYDFGNTVYSGLVAATTSTTTQFALIQYLDQTTAREMLFQRNSIKIRAQTNAGSLGVTVGIYWTTNTSPVFPVVASGTGAFFSTLVAGVPTTLAANWTQMSRGPYSATASFTLTTTNQEFDIPWFNLGFTFGDNITATGIAIVVGFNGITSAQAALVNYISCVPGDIPSPPAPLSKAQTLAALQTYYETSYGIGATVPSATGVNCLLDTMSWNTVSAALNCYAVGFNVRYAVPKRVITAPTLYSLVATPANVSATVENQAISPTVTDAAVGTFWTLTPGKVGAAYVPKSANVMATIGVSGAYSSAYIQYQYVADARFGVV